MKEKIVLSKYSGEKLFRMGVEDALKGTFRSKSQATGHVFEHDDEYKWSPEERELSRLYREYYAKGYDIVKKLMIDGTIVRRASEVVLDGEDDKKKSKIVTLRVYPNGTEKPVTTFEDVKDIVKSYLKKQDRGGREHEEER
jgi:hypothetical protein